MNHMRVNHSRSYGYMDAFSSSEDDSDAFTDSELSSDSSNSTDEDLRNGGIKLLLVNGRQMKPKNNTTTCKGSARVQIGGRENYVQGSFPKQDRKIRFAETSTEFGSSGEEKRGYIANEANNCNPSINQKHKTTITINRTSKRFDEDDHFERVKSNGQDSVAKTRNPVTKIRIQSVKKKTDDETEFRKEGFRNNSNMKLKKEENDDYESCSSADRKEDYKQMLFNGGDRQDTKYRKSKENGISEKIMKYSKLESQISPKSKYICSQDGGRNSLKRTSSEEFVDERTNEEYSNVIRQASVRMFGLVGKKVPKSTDNFKGRNVDVKEQRRIFAEKLENALQRNCISKQQHSGQEENKPKIVDESIKKTAFTEKLENILQQTGFSKEQQTVEVEVYSNTSENLKEVEEEDWPEPPSFEELFDHEEGQSKVHGTEVGYIGGLMETEKTDYVDDVFVNEQDEYHKDGMMDDDSCIVCDILSNEERLARRSADMDVFRKSAMNDCNKVMQKMENAQNIVRKLSGNGSSLRRSGRDPAKQNLAKGVSNSPIVQIQSPGTAYKQCSGETGAISDVRSSQSIPIRSQVSDVTSKRDEKSTELETFAKRPAYLPWDTKRSQPRLRKGVSIDLGIEGEDSTCDQDVRDQASNSLTVSNKQGIVKDKRTSKQSKSTNDVTVESDIHAAARRHCKELIDSGGYLIPQPSKKKERPKAKARLSDDFLIVENMPCSQKIEPWGKKNSGSSRRIGNSQQETRAAVQGNSLKATPEYSNTYPVPAASILHNNSHPFASLPRTLPPNTVSQPSRSGTLPRDKTNTQHQTSFSTPSPRKQRPVSNFLDYGSKSAPVDPSRVEREQNWLRKAVRRIRRSLSFEEKDRKRPSKTLPRDRPILKRSNSSGTMDADREYPSKDSRAYLSSDAEMRKIVFQQSLPRSKKHLIHPAGKTADRPDPNFHPKYGYAENITENFIDRQAKNDEKNTGKVRDRLSIRPDENGNYKNPNSNLRSSLNALNGTTTNPYYATQQAQNMHLNGTAQQHYYAQNGGSSPRQQYGDNYLMAPLDVKFSSQKTASTKNLQPVR